MTSLLQKINRFFEPSSPHHFTAMNRLIAQTSIRHQHSFAKLFRQSKFVELGDMNGRLVRGKVVHRVGKDLYIDFGFKFNAVCKTPIKDAE